MKKIFTLIAVAMAMVAAPAAAQVTLYDQTNLPQQFVTPLNLTFTATEANTTLNFQGYNIPSTTTLVNLFFNLTGTTQTTANNLLSTNYSYTPAPSNPFANLGSIGLYGARDLTFAGGTIGSYDTFSQTVATTIGSSYTLGLSFTEPGGGADGLRITTGAIASVPAVPEPTTWAMMLLGFGGMGVALRRRRKTVARAQLA